MIINDLFNNKKFVAEAIGDLGSKRDQGKTIRKWRKSRGLDEQGGVEGLNEFAPDDGGGESGRWYTDDQMTDIVGDGWYQDLDVSGDIPKQQMIQQAQAWLDDQGYDVQVLNCKINDDDMEWYIEGSFQNSGFAKKGMAEDLDKSNSNNSTQDRQKKADDAAKRFMQGVAEDANLNYIWIQGDFDGDTASSGATQGSWRDQQSTPVKLTRGRMTNVRPLSGPPPEGGKTIKQAQIPLTLDAGEQKFSTTGVDLQLTVAPNGYVTNGEVGRVRGTAVVKIMRPESVEEDLTRRGFLRGLGAAALAGAAGGALAGSNDPSFVGKVHDQHNAMIEKNPRYAKEHDALGIYLARGIAGASAENNKRWVEKTAKLLQKYGVNVNEGMAEGSSLVDRVQQIIEKNHQDGVWAGQDLLEFIREVYEGRIPDEEEFYDDIDALEYEDNFFNELVQVGAFKQGVA